MDHQVIKINILAISGSLRQASYNTAALKALKKLAPQNIDVNIASIGDLPLFNPDLDADDIVALDQLSKDVKKADGIIIASPEYAHGISGPMKNALDWLVSSVDLPYKPVMLINTSPRASHAMEALQEVLVTMSVNIIESACISIPLLSSELSVEGIVKHHEISSTLLSALNDFTHAIKN